MVRGTIFLSDLHTHKILNQIWAVTGGQAHSLFYMQTCWNGLSYLMMIYKYAQRSIFLSIIQLFKDFFFYFVSCSSTLEYRPINNYYLPAIISCNLEHYLFYSPHKLMIRTFF